MPIGFSLECVCHVHSDPIVNTCDNVTLVITGAENVTLTKYMNPDEPCGLGVEVQQGPKIEWWFLCILLWFDGTIYELYFYAETVEVSGNSHCIYHIKLPQIN